jgi:hypothetical protein
VGWSRVAHVTRALQWLRTTRKSGRVGGATAEGALVRRSVEAIALDTFRHILRTRGSARAGAALLRSEAWHVGPGIAQETPYARRRAGERTRSAEPSWPTGRTLSGGLSGRPDWHRPTVALCLVLYSALVGATCRAGGAERWWERRVSGLLHLALASRQVRAQRRAGSSGASAHACLPVPALPGNLLQRPARAEDGVSPTHVRLA